MMSLHKTFVRPHVEYCVSAWNPHYIKDKQEGQHPLTGQSAANFRLLANQ